MERPLRTYLDFEKPIAELESKVADLRTHDDGTKRVSLKDELTKLEAKGEGRRWPRPTPS